MDKIDTIKIIFDSIQNERVSMIITLASLMIILLYQVLPNDNFVHKSMEGIMIYAVIGCIISFCIYIYSKSKQKYEPTGYAGIIKGRKDGEYYCDKCRLKGIESQLGLSPKGFCCVNCDTIYMNPSEHLDFWVNQTKESERKYIKHRVEMRGVRDVISPDIIDGKFIINTWIIDPQALFYVVRKGCLTNLNKDIEFEIKNIKDFLFYREDIIKFEHTILNFAP